MLTLRYRDLRLHRLLTIINAQLCLNFARPPLRDAVIFKYQRTFESIILTSGSFQHDCNNDICSISHHIPYNTIINSFINISVIKSTDTYLYFGVIAPPPMSHLSLSCVGFPHWSWL